MQLALPAFRARILRRDALEVCIKTISNGYVAPVIDSEGRVNVNAFTNVPDELLQHGITVFCQGLVGRIIW